MPKLRDVNVRASVNISDATLLEYQHDLATNSTYFNIELTLDPANSEISPLQQYFIVNGLCDEFMFTLNYDESIVAEAENSDSKETLLVEYARNICNEKMTRELNIAEKLLGTDHTELFACIEAKVDDLLDAEIDPKAIEAGIVTLTEKSSIVFLEWSSMIKPCIEKCVKSAGLDAEEISIEEPFELIDLAKVKSLGSIFGVCYEGNSDWTPHKLEVRKYHPGSVQVCANAKLSEEQIKKCIAHCAASYFTNIAKPPLGSKFRESATRLQQKYISLAQEYYKIVRSMRREQEVANTKLALKHANKLIKELDSRAERLKLAIDQGLPYRAIYYETLSGYIRSEIENTLQDRLKELYSCGRVDVSQAISHVETEGRSFLQQWDTGQTSSPELLTLRVSKLVRNYFDEHPWLSDLGVRKPQINVLAEPGPGRNVAAVQAVGEYVLVSYSIRDQSTHGNAEIIIDINRILLEFDQVEANAAVENIRKKADGLG
ncbi:MAG: hypothetical protein OER87_10085 [Gammaproteobacteria bacterium]|nr:hypothetical protein [Gammaproteobacteria bacterium]